MCWALGLTPGELVFRRWLDTRLIPFPGKPERTTDTVAHVESIADNHYPWLVAAAFQGQPDPDMLGRILIYLGTLWLEHKPVAASGDRFSLAGVVINLTRVGQTSRRMRWKKAGVELTLLVRERNLETIGARGILRQIAAGNVSRVLLCFVPLMRGGCEPTIIQQWQHLASAESNARRRSDYAGVALVLAEKAGCANVWKDSLQEWNVVQSKQVMEWQAQARSESELKTRVEALLEVLTTRFGPVPVEVTRAIATAASVPVLKQWLKMAVMATSLQDFRAQAEV